MWNRLVASSFIYPLLFLSVVIAVLAGFALRSRVLLPVLDVSLAYPLLFTLIATGQRKRALKAMLFWALCLGVVTVSATVRAPEAAARAIFHGPEYVSEMFHWIRTGAGAEGSPAQFIPQHVLHFAVFAVLSLLSASLLSLAMGALLMNYMSFYVGSLIHASREPALAALMGWHPWSIIRVISFVTFGVILAEPLICRWTKRKYDYHEVKTYFWLAIAGLLLDMLIKAILAPWWGMKLRTLL